MGKNNKTMTRSYSVSGKFTLAELKKHLRGVRVAKITEIKMAKSPMPVHIGKG